MRDSLQDWEGIVQERCRSWEAEVRQRQLRAQIPRQHSAWQRRTGKWLIWVGGWLTQCGEEMAESESTAGVSMAG